MRAAINHPSLLEDFRVGRQGDRSVCLLPPSGVPVAGPGAFSSSTFLALFGKERATEVQVIIRGSDPNPTANHRGSVWEGALTNPLFPLLDLINFVCLGPHRQCSGIIPGGIQGIRCGAGD